MHYPGLRDICAKFCCPYYETAFRLPLDGAITQDIFDFGPAFVQRTG